MGSVFSHKLFQASPVAGIQGRFAELRRVGRGFFPAESQGIKDAGSRKVRMVSQDLSQRGKMLPGEKGGIPEANGQLLCIHRFMWRPPGALPAGYRFVEDILHQLPVDHIDQVVLNTGERQAA